MSGPVFSQEISHVGVDDPKKDPTIDAVEILCELKHVKEECEALRVELAEQKKTNQRQDAALEFSRRRDLEHDNRLDLGEQRDDLQDAKDREQDVFIRSVRNRFRWGLLLGVLTFVFMAANFGLMAWAVQLLKDMHPKGHSGYVVLEDNKGSAVHLAQTAFVGYDGAQAWREQLEDHTHQHHKFTTMDSEDGWDGLGLISAQDMATYNATLCSVPATVNQVTAQAKIHKYMNDDAPTYSLPLKLKSCASGGDLIEVYYGESTAFDIPTPRGHCTVNNGEGFRVRCFGSGWGSCFFQVRYDNVCPGLGYRERRPASLSKGNDMGIASHTEAESESEDFDCVASDHMMKMRRGGSSGVTQTVPLRDLRIGDEVWVVAPLPTPRWMWWVGAGGGHIEREGAYAGHWTKVLYNAPERPSSYLQIHAYRETVEVVLKGSAGHIVPVWGRNRKLTTTCTSQEREEEEEGTVGHAHGVPELVRIGSVRPGDVLLRWCEDSNQTTEWVVQYVDRGYGGLGFVLTEAGWIAPEGLIVSQASQNHWLKFYIVSLCVGIPHYLLPASLYQHLTQFVEPFVMTAFKGFADPLLGAFTWGVRAK